MFEAFFNIFKIPDLKKKLLITLGLLVHWATLPLLVMLPIFLFLYYRLARKEEREMVKEFGDKYKEYRKRVPTFIPSFNFGLSKSRMSVKIKVKRRPEGERVCLNYGLRRPTGQGSLFIGIRLLTPA